MNFESTVKFPNGKELPKETLKVFIMQILPLGLACSSGLTLEAVLKTVNTVGKAYSLSGHQFQADQDRKLSQCLFKG